MEQKSNNSGHRIIEAGDIGSFRLLLASIQRNGYLMNLVAINGNIEMMNAIIEAKWEIDEHSLVLAAQACKLEMVKYLVPHISVRGVNPMIGAAIGGNLEIIRYLHEMRFPFDKEDYQMAARFNHPRALILLHNLGCPWATFAINETLVAMNANAGERIALLNIVLSHRPMRKGLSK